MMVFHLEGIVIFFKNIFAKYIHIHIACMVIVCSGYLVRHGLVSVQNEFSFQEVVVVPGRKKGSFSLTLSKQVTINLRRNSSLLKQIILMKINHYFVKKFSRGIF